MSQTGTEVRSMEQLRAEYGQLMPVVQRQARLAFRFVRCAQTREDAIAEVIALGWKLMLHYTKRNIDPARFPRMFAKRLIGSFNSGRRAHKQETRSDALSTQARRYHGFKLLSWHDHVGKREPAFAEEVAFSLDFDEWLASLKPRHRMMVQRLLEGSKASEVAAELGFNCQYFSHLRAALHLHWQAFASGKPFRCVHEAFLFLRSNQL